MATTPYPTRKISHGGQQALAATRKASKEPSKDQVRKAGGDHARKQCTALFANSRVKDNTEELPKFTFEELQIGKLLGKGGFGTVKEIRGFKIGGNVKNVRGVNADEDADGMESRVFIAEHCIRNGGDARYAVKYLSPEVVDDPAQFIQGIKDMAVETRFLSDIEHPNIIKLRALSSGDRFAENYFIVMDRLYDTLEKRIKTWEGKLRGFNGFTGKLKDPKGSKKEAFMIERLVAAFDLCAALRYLHERKIIYRDIKPENIGFDVRGDVKLFDFGLAKEITSSVAATKDSDGNYRLTGDTGSLRYMAPEVATSKPYNEKCDVYSMSVLIWAMLACKTPYEAYTPKSLRDKVYTGEHKRPPIPEDWPQSIKLLLVRGWTGEVSNRSIMKNLEEILKKEIAALRSGDTTGLEHTRRRSTFVYRGNKPGARGSGASMGFA